MSKSKILIVDDSKTYLHFAVGALEKAGYEVISADNAWISNVVNRERPDLILMDVQLGAVSGVAAVSALRNRNFCAGIKILLHSSETNDTLAEMAKTCGADGYLHKDGREDTLLQGVQRTLRSREKQVAH
jgi:twitching motility two-component system response regulator PilH